MNSIVFTQDLPGEREWLAKKFPGFVNLETINSQKWPTDYPLAGIDNHLYEIAVSDQFDNLKDCSMPKYKSIFSNSVDHLIKGKWWNISDHVLHDLTFSNTLKSNNYIILNLPRSGTLFVKSLFDLKYTEYKQHESIGLYEQLVSLASLIKEKQLTVVLVYRKNSWDWVTSNIISFRSNFYHYDSYRENLINNFNATVEEIDKMLEIQISTWNFWCNLKCAIPDLNCYLLEFSETIPKYQHLSNHIKIPYNKEKIILNYHELKDLFDVKYKEQFEETIVYGVRHLKQMGCKTDLYDLDLDNNSSIITS